LQLRQQFLDPVDDLDDVGTGLPLNVDDDRRQLFIHAACLTFSARQ
jgi:hypothetical protein